MLDKVRRALEQAMRALNWEEKGLKIYGKCLSNLIVRFADDVAITEVREMADEFIEACLSTGLKVNVKKRYFCRMPKKNG